MKNFTPITSTTNPLVKQLRALVSSKKARQESQSFIVEGWRGIDTLLTHASRPYRIEKLVVTESWVTEGRLPESVEIVVLADHVFEKISDVKNAQGILGVMKHTAYPFEFYPDTGRYLVLDNIRDPGNLGTLIRSAVGAGFDGVLLFGDCVEPFNPKVIRSTMGTFAFADIHPVTLRDLEQMIDTDYELCVTTGLDGDSLYETGFSKKTILVIGSEAHGVSGELFKLAAKKITIPLAKECESLNAAIAGSICMFHIAKD